LAGPRDIKLGDQGLLNLLFSTTLPSYAALSNSFNANKRLFTPVKQGCSACFAAASDAQLTSQPPNAFQSSSGLSNALLQKIHRVCFVNRVKARNQEHGVKILHFTGESTVSVTNNHCHRHSKLSANQ
jgi:hypothetical protein